MDGVMQYYLLKKKFDEKKMITLHLFILNMELMIFLKMLEVNMEKELETYIME